ncbi:MAG: hypothetical protein GF317_07930, partial [Candidatus Lokiarchaeota archaeon]|nr:hypothetical protein [Candidatus Lokiarchaeota archaeon]MBD3199641.1 hypothetical protein [Candidatus Lokiarchaeota archaeon]
MGDKEFIINPFLTMRLEVGKTTIYVKGEPFSQCKYLFIIDPENTVKEKINSIDDAQAMMGGQLEEEIKPEDLGITPEEEFWGHCSNLQAWAEYGYDTRLLHSNLSFPLVKRLTEVGDPQARRVFKEEIVKRYYEGNENVRTFLRSEGYLEYISRDELWSPIKSDTEVLKELERRSPKKLILFSNFELKDYEIITLDLSFKEIKEVPRSLVKLTYLEDLELHGPEGSTIPEWIGELNSLKRLDLTYETASVIPESIGDLGNLEYLRIYSPHLKVIPESIGNLKTLRKLKISGEALENIPEGIGGLESLEELHINRTSIRTLPDSIGN